MKGDGKFKFIHQSDCRTSPISQLNINNGQSLVGQFTFETPLLNFILRLYELIISLHTVCNIYTRMTKGWNCLSCLSLNLTNRIRNFNPIKNSRAHV